MASIADKQQIKKELEELSIKYLEKFIEYGEIAIGHGFPDKEAFMMAVRAPLPFTDMLMTTVQCSMKIEGFIEKLAKLIESELTKHKSNNSEN